MTNGLAGQSNLRFVLDVFAIVITSNSSLIAVALTSVFAGVEYAKINTLEVARMARRPQKFWFICPYLYGAPGFFSAAEARLSGLI